MTATAAPTSPACPRCGSAMPGDAPAGLCPRCLLSDGFGNVSEGDFRLRTGQGGPRFVPPTIDELAGEFPHLEFVQLLGSGGMGAVYLAKQIRLDRRVAVKILPPDLADDPAFAERFLREARALARLSHPNIVGVYDFGQTPGGLYYFLMEYIEGPTLRQVVANRTTEPKQALEIVRQVCDALQFAHDKGVVHRDIKPENILLDSQGRVKIADFGLAKLLGIAEPQPGSPAAGSLTHTRQAMGTPHYMAPEQITGSRGVDHRADIYSLGVVFYELLTGELPVGRFAPPSKKVQVDVRLDEVVLRSLEAEPNQRYQRASDVKTDVESISSTSPRNDDSPFPAATRFVREASAGTGRAVRRALAPTGPGQLSKYAIVALVWAATVPLALLCIALFETFERSVDVLEALFAMLGFLLALPAITAPIGTTLMGIAAVREVRRSNGSVTGLVPGLAAALLFPLLLIGPFLWWLIAVFLVFTVTGPSDEEVAIVVSLMLVAPFAAWLMTRITRAAWRKAADGLPPELIERELSIIPPAVRQAVQAIGDWVERMGLSSETLFGRAIPAEPVAAANEPAVAHYSVASTPATPRMSFKAIVGACWAVTLPLGALMFAFVENTPRGDPVYGIAVGLLGLFSVPAMTAPIATTLLGWSAVGDIRRSAGMIKGLPLAVFDGLCFPLLLLSSIMAIPVTALLVWIAYEAFSVFAHNYGPLQVIVLALIVLGIVGAIDAIIAFLVWRRVKASLSPVDEAQPAAPPPAEPESWLEPVTLRRHRDLVMAGIAITVALTLIGLQLLIENGFPRWRSHQPATVARDSAAPAVEVATSGGEMAAMPGAITEEDRERGWRMTPNGPEILPEWAANMLALYDQFPAGELDPNLAYTPEPINAALQNAHARYEEVLDNHTAATFEGDVVVFTIEPFPEELDRLTNEFWSRVDPLLNVDQQSILRYNFPLRYNQRHHLRDHRHNFVLPIGDGRWTIRIERSGQWYRWSARYPNAPPGTTDSPELPQYLRRFQYEFTRLTSLRNDGLAFDPQRLPLVAPKPAGTASTPSPFPANFADAGGMPPFGPLTGTDGMDMMGTDMYGSSSMAMSGDTGMMEMGMYGGNAPPGAVEMGMGFLPGNVDDDAALRNAFVQRGIDAGKAGEIVRIILSIEQDYRTVLEDHTQVSVEGATVHFSVRPFPEKLDELERRFWASVDPLLTVDQQRGLRKSLSVGKPWFATRDETAGLSTSGFGAQATRNVPAILAVGRGITRLSIERVGQWYRWNLDGGEEGQTGHVRPQQETPSLPRWLRHFQDRYDELVPRSK